MKIRVKNLKKLVNEAIAASKEYGAKEQVRQEIQNLIKDKINSGQIQSEDDLKNLIASLNMAINSLKLVPLDIWKKLK